MSSPVGTLLSGRYRLDAKIGAGGMSMVFRAYDTVLERQVAIKLMHAGVHADADQLERFRREARAVAQLNHPHIVGVIDAGEDGQGTAFIVLEYVEGETLKDCIRRHGRLPVGEAIAYAIEIARALGAAHAQGIVHRDVKPQNVLIDEEGSAKVTDFGIALKMDQTGLTVDGSVLGTTDYVSPEQALGQQVDGQSDLYSLGIVLYEMLIGEVPFTGETQVAVAMKHVREDLPDVQVRRPELSSALASVVDRATAKDLNVRYRTDLELTADLEEALVSEIARSGQATGEATAILRTLPARTQRRVPQSVLHRGRLALLALVVAVVAVALVVGLRDRTQRGTGTPPPRAGVPTQQGTEGVSLAQSSARDFDPKGDGEEHREETGFVVDNDPNTGWSTETYQPGALTQKGGVGIYVDAKPAAAAVRIDVDTPTPGWRGQIYAAKDGEPPEELEDWAPLSDIGSAEESNQITLDGTPYRYFLVWIEEPPPDEKAVEISGISLTQTVG
ncbi:MAG: serine/threonine protein kinase [Solirubrobacterales bacterium]|nr:serine/threonine protein kinase [Solirubrobacterales bacterium]